MAAASTISAGTAIRGRLTVDGDLEVNGPVVGSIEAKGDVTLGSGALIKSDVVGERLLVSGAVAGNLQGRQLVVLESGARVQGDVTAPTVGIRPGALLRGRVDAAGGAGLSPKARTVVTKQPAAVSKSAKPTAPAATEEKPAKKATRRAAPPPVIPKASGRAKKASAKQRKAEAPVPRVPALKKRAKKAVKRRSR